MKPELGRLTGFRVKHQKAGGTPLGRMFSQDLESEAKNCKTREILYESKFTIYNPDDSEKSTPITLHYTYYATLHLLHYTTHIKLLIN